MLHTYLYHLKVFPQVSADFAFIYKLVYYSIFDPLLKLVLPLTILLFTNLSIYRLVSKKKTEVREAVIKKKSKCKLFPNWP